MTSWEGRVNPKLAEPALMGSSPAGTKRCKQSPGAGPLGPSTAPMSCCNEPGPGSPAKSKRRGGKDRAGDKATAWVQSPSMSQGQRQGWIQAVIYVRKAHPGDRLPTAQVLGPLGGGSGKRLETNTPKM